MATLHVFSKLSADQNYHDWIPGGADMPVKAHTVLIKGGAGVITKNLLTPLGVHTEISEKDAEMLNCNEVFKLHQKNGFVQIQKKNADVEKVAADMADTSDYKTTSRQLTSQDFDKEKNEPQPMDGKKKE